MFKRKVYDKLLEWKNISNQYALFLEGARRIGKSTIAEEFAKNEYEDYLILDFAIEGEDVKNEFRNNLSNMDSFFRNLFVHKGKELPPHKSVIILDEVQRFPLARQAIKYLVKDGRYDYIETGSLISIKNNAEKILIPSEEYKVKMFPMDFEEFLWAQGDTITIPVVKDAFKKCKPLGEALHRKILSRFREYMAVGGMPQAVNAYVNGATFGQIDFIKQQILDLYEEDLRTYDSENRERASVIFHTIPEQLNNHNSHFKFSVVDKTARYKNYIDAVGFVSESMMGNECIGVTKPEIDMESYADKSDFKLYMGDTGLLIAQMIRYNTDSKEEIYKKILFGKGGINYGMAMENAVAQALRASGHSLYFHRYVYNEGDFGENDKNSTTRTKNYEIDFMIVRKQKICPIEVKSSNYRTHKSFDYLRKKYSWLKLQDQYVIYTKDIQRVDDIVYIPVYMTMFL